MKHDVGLAALIVNYNTGTYALCCVESLIGDWERAGRSRDDVVVSVAPHGQRADQETARRYQDLGVDQLVVAFFARDIDGLARAADQIAEIRADG